MRGGILDRNLRTLLDQWSNEADVLEEPEHSMVVSMWRQLEAVVTDDGRSHLASFSDGELVWRALPKIVMVHSDEDPAVAGYVFEFDPQTLRAGVECEDGAVLLDIPFEWGRNDDPRYWTEEDVQPEARARILRLCEQQTALAANGGRR